MEHTLTVTSGPGYQIMVFTNDHAGARIARHSSHEKENLALSDTEIIEAVPDQVELPC